MAYDYGPYEGGRARDGPTPVNAPCISTVYFLLLLVASILPFLYNSTIITQPLPRNSTRAGEAAGFAAQKAHSGKINKCTRRWESYGLLPSLPIYNPTIITPTKYQRATRTVLDSQPVSLAREVSSRA